MEQVIGVSALIRDNGRVLVILRARPPYVDHWSLPGGKVEVGESPHQAIIREVREEVGLTITVGPLVRTFPSQVGGVDYLISCFLATITSGLLAPSDDAAAAEWVLPEELERRKVTPGLLDLIS